MKYLLDRFAGMIQLARPRHWVKNLFVLSPLLFTPGRLFDGASVICSAFATAAFCLLSSAVYVLNDLRDIEADRRHPVKRFSRPIASGLVSSREAMLMFALLLSGALLCSLEVPTTIPILMAYLAVNVAYSFGLKRMPVVVIFAVASGFVLRVKAGAVALSLVVSDWMLITTGCLALYLAVVKRRQELISSGGLSREVLNQYSVRLVDRYAELSATAALIFYGLFVTTTRPMLVPTVPFVLFGLFRYWYLVEQQQSGESPTDTMLTDVPLMMTVSGWAGLCGWYLQHA